MNRVLGDYFENLLYQIFVAIDEQTTVREVYFELFGFFILFFGEDFLSVGVDFTTFSNFSYQKR